MEGYDAQAKKLRAGEKDIFSLVLWEVGFGSRYAFSLDSKIEGYGTKLVFHEKARGFDCQD